MISRMRKTGHFFIFSPVQDLSLIAKGGAANISASEEVKQDVQRNGGEVIGDEWARQIVRASPFFNSREQNVKYGPDTRRGSRTGAGSSSARA